MSTSIYAVHLESSHGNPDHGNPNRERRASGGRRRQSRNTSRTYLYHYTTLEALDKILKTRVLRASEDQLTDSSMGKGVYFTRMRPNSSDERLLINNWEGHKKSKYRVRAYIGVRVEDFGDRLRCMDSRRSVCVVKEISGCRKIHIRHARTRRRAESSTATERAEAAE